MNERGDGTRGRERYEVRCAVCRAPYDALAAAWCRCLVKERSLVCPSCGACSCKAPRSYREKLWTEAPQELWDRKMEEHRRGAALPPNPPPKEVSRPLVLVVDDEAEVLRIAREAVASLGHGVVVARDGEEGLALARAYRPDVVLSDALMPKLDGREMCRRIKEDLALASVRTVVMTSVYRGTAQRYEAIGAFHVDEYLAKPLDQATLAAVLEKLLAGRKGG